MSTEHNRHHLNVNSMKNFHLRVFAFFGSWVIHEDRIVTRGDLHESQFVRGTTGGLSPSSQALDTLSAIHPPFPPSSFFSFLSSRSHSVTVPLLFPPLLRCLTGSVPRLEMMDLRPFIPSRHDYFLNCVRKCSKRIIIV